MIDAFFDEVNKVVDDYLQNFFEGSSFQKPTVGLGDFQIPEVDCLRYVEFVGSAHLSGRSVGDVLEVIGSMKPVGVCLELCSYRYEALHRMCDHCLERKPCQRKCEFVAAVEALEKVSLDVWLIDMVQEEIMARVLAKASSEEAKAWQRLQRYVAQREAYGLRLWEEGLKDEAMHLFNGDLELMRKTFPTLWRVLILERNALMACRLVYLISQYLNKGLKDFKIVVFIGAAHVEGTRALLEKPRSAFQLLDQFGIAFSPPNMIIRN